MIPLSLWVIAAALVPAANSLPQNNQTNFLLIMFYFVLLVANLIPIERDNVNNQWCSYSIAAGSRGGGRGRNGALRP